MDEEAIVQRCKEGDLMAYRLLYERYEQPFLRTAYRMLGRQQDAEDAVQDTFLKLHRGIRHYKCGSRFSTYFSGYSSIPAMTYSEKEARR